MFSGVPNNNSNTKLNHYVVYRSNDNVVQSNSLYSLLYIENKYTSINPGKKTFNLISTYQSVIEMLPRKMFLFLF